MILKRDERLEGGDTMLDQNTDRSWWMIGAVVVGAAIIGIALFIFPDLLESISAMFGAEIDGIEIGNGTAPGN